MPSFNKNSTSIPSVKNANKSTPPSIILLEGYLMKQKHGKCKAWLKRYFVLYEEELRYYKTKNDTNALAVISLDHYSLVPDAQPLTSLNQKQWKYNTFCLVSDDETKFDWPDYFLQAHSPENRTVWVDNLQNHVSQSTTVLEKWLDRLHLPPQDVQALSIRQPTTTFTKKLPKLPALPAASESCDDVHHLPPQLQTLRCYKSTESFNTFTTHSSNMPSTKRRPSEFLPSKSSEMSSKLLSSKMFTWARSKSNNSSVSSIPESVHTTTDVEDNNSSQLLCTPKMTPVALELPIIHPSEYNQDDNPSECILKSRDATTNYFYAKNKLFSTEQQPNL